MQSRETQITMVKWTNAGGQTKRANERSFVYRPPAWRRWRNVKTTYCCMFARCYWSRNFDPAFCVSSPQRFPQGHGIPIESFSNDDGADKEKWIRLLFQFCCVYSTLLKKSNVLFRWIFLELNSREPHPNVQRERNIPLSVLTSSKKRRIRKFHVLVVQGWQENLPKSVLHVQSCCFTH